MALLITACIGAILGVWHFIDSLKRCKGCGKRYKDWDDINDFTGHCYKCEEEFREWLKSPTAEQMFRDGRLKL